MLSLKTGAILTLGLFSILTAVAIVIDGPNGFPEAITHSQMTLQIWLDLVIVAVFWCAWVIKDARAEGRSPWLWVVGTLLFGALVPLIYVIRHGKWPASEIQSQPSDNSSRRRIVCAIVLGLFAIQTVLALIGAGGDPTGDITRSWSNIQIFIDLVIMIVFWIAWMVKDARRNGRSPWIWTLSALITGSFSPLLYLLVNGRWPASHPIDAKTVSSD